ncbi:helix-turn-helix domain-containing protein [Peribacillus deserti]
MSPFENGKEKAVRFSILEAKCKTFDCKPGDIL